MSYTVDMNITSQLAFRPSQSDIDDVCATIVAFERAQQHEDVDAFMALFLPEAVWTTGHGMRLEGAKVIEDFTRKVLPGAMKESMATYTPERIFFVTPDVAIVNILQQPVTLTGAILPDEPVGVPVQVLYKIDGIWKIAAAQNTQVIT